MNVVVIDKSPVFIQGLSIGLNDFMHDVNVIGVNDIDEVWSCLDEMSQVFILLNCNQESGEYSIFLETLHEKYIGVSVIIMVDTIERHILNNYLKHHVMGVILKTSPVDSIAQALKTVSMGMVCLPDDGVIYEGWSVDNSVKGKLSERQHEVLQLIASGASNKQISRTLNISAGTVKSHLESIFRRLNVRNRTQAAIVLLEEERR
ncbi:response regulator transcription factor [Pectobacterium polaris]|uniref:Response regulator transcription factor n=1 Tax=Pectobacterium polaris TaxID=2042057 RepID=A0AAW4P0T1_9GAMM|nr:response regulator transcription factor [Pectobacterium polaris]ASY82123.1 helix-turn-helix transcriptional regulator [Pectobacterium polaris]MBW5892944.1 response regulator transcription factor [Pectobacterium polaris]MCA6939815.1 response regulator transcription factor [Pectobacterium polaris]MCA6955618.1 response regulator transcription factor [Pectobacterium polaris]UAY91468.1 response regulator transcription factor [Pectobacterium polaris]